MGGALLVWLKSGGSIKGNRARSMLKLIKVNYRRLRFMSDKKAERPSFKHDCKECIYLGSMDGNDLYFCNKHQDLSSTILARFGNEVSKFASGIELADYNPFLGEAMKRAVERGLLKV